MLERQVGVVHHAICASVTDTVNFADDLLGQWLFTTNKNSSAARSVKAFFAGCSLLEKSHEGVGARRRVFFGYEMSRADADTLNVPGILAPNIQRRNS